jgi:hypothetical protein
LLHRGQLLANRPLSRAESAEELRAFYFSMTGEKEFVTGNL